MSADVFSQGNERTISFVDCGSVHSACLPEKFCFEVQLVDRVENDCGFNG